MIKKIKLADSIHFMQGNVCWTREIHAKKKKIVLLPVSYRSVVFSSIPLFIYFLDVLNVSPEDIFDPCPTTETCKGVHAENKKNIPRNMRGWTARKVRRR